MSQYDDYSSFHHPLSSDVAMGAQASTCLPYFVLIPYLEWFKFEGKIKALPLDPAGGSAPRPPSRNPGYVTASQTCQTWMKGKVLLNLARSLFGCTFICWRFIHSSYGFKEFIGIHHKIPELKATPSIRCDNSIRLLSLSNRQQPLKIGHCNIRNISNVGLSS